MALLYELDHLFICVSIGAPEAQRLISFGFTEGSANTHPGQGTANRRFFFHNAMIELLFVTDAAEAAAPSVRRTGLLERWQKRHTTASPFGFCLRPGPEAIADQAAPFSAWAYEPSYASSPIYVGTNSLRVEEPLLFYLPFGHKPERGEQPLRHAVGFEEITALRLHGPSGAQVSSELSAVIETGVVELGKPGEPLLEVGFDGEKTGKSDGFGGELPLKLCW